MKFKEEFTLLESLGAVDCDDPGDIFSLIAVYGASVEAQVSIYFEGMRTRKKRKDTKNPNFPGGTRRRWELLTEFTSFLRPLSPDVIEEVFQVGEDYWSRNEDLPRLSQEDPLDDPHDRTMRMDYISALRPFPLAYEYASHRSYTLQLLASSTRLRRDYELAEEAAHSSVQQLRLLLQSAPTQISLIQPAFFGFPNNRDS
jgi:hypothetical protein